MENNRMRIRVRKESQCDFQHVKRRGDPVINFLGLP